jgi:hypothetical protein
VSGILPSIVLGIALGALSANSFAAGAVNAYGTKVSFTKARPLQFPDFILEYAGERRQSSERFPRGFVYYDFIASTASERITVSWSAGTGDIGPAIFTIARKQFWLELVMSDTLGRLKPDELVISIKRPVP